MQIKRNSYFGNILERLGSSQKSGFAIKILNYDKASEQLKFNRHGLNVVKFSGYFGLRSQRIRYAAFFEFQEIFP